MYEFNAGIQEPWDGPALLVFADGKRVGATLDRNGLRPARWCTTADGFVIMGSETGVVDLSGKTVVQKGRLGPGQMVAVDLESGQLLDNWTVKEDAAGRFPYGDWLQQHRRSVAAQPWTQERQIGELDLLRLQTAMGFTAEDFDLVIEDMAGLGKEPTYCMGDDIPLAVLSDKPHLLYDYFKQRFAQVTNPPIDPLREKLVMSLEMHLGERRPALKPQAEAAAVIHLDTPVLNEAELAAISQQGLPVQTLSTQVAVEACAGGLKFMPSRRCAKRPNRRCGMGPRCWCSPTGWTPPVQPALIGHNGGDAGIAGGGCGASPPAATEAAAALLPGGGHRPVLEHPPHGLPDRLRRQCGLPLAHLGDHPPLARSSQNAEADRAGQAPRPRCRQGAGQRAGVVGERPAQDPLQDRHLAAGQLPRRPDLRSDRPWCRCDRNRLHRHHQPCGGDDPGRTGQ